MISMKMPILQPLPIKTKEAANFIYRFVIWILSIRQWRVCEDWHYTLRDGTDIVIPKGFTFDGASIPRPLWMFLSPTGLLFIPGLVHDYAYKYNKLLSVDSKGNLIDYQAEAGKAYWDKVFREIGIDVNGIAVIDFLAWVALAVGGWLPWWKHRKVERLLIENNNIANSNG